MAEWIQSHPALENHPKFLLLCALLKMDKDTVIGKLHRFWWWCSVYAEDGDLRKYGILGVNALLQLPLKDSSLIHAGFIDSRPYLRAHDWFNYYGRFLKIKYRNNSAKLMQIEKLCTTKCNTRATHVLDMSSTSSLRDRRRRSKTYREDREDVDVPGAKREFASLEGQVNGKHPDQCTCEICFKNV